MKDHSSETQQLVYFNIAFLALTAGAFWLIALATAQYTFSDGLIFLTTGVICLIRGLRARQKPGR
jgi:hypothetical protein